MEGYNPNDAWWRPGWTAQNHSFVPPEGEEPDPLYPPTIPVVNVVATYLDDEGAPLSSRILVRPNATYRDDATGTTIMPRVRAYVIKHGRLDINLPSSDSEAIEKPFTYTVREAFPGGRQFAINVPAAKSETGPVPLHTLKVDDANIIPIDSMPPTYGWHSPTTY